MKRLLTAVAAALAVTAFHAPGATAQAFENNYNETMAIGGALSMGMATTLGDGYAELIDVDPDQKTLRFCAGGSLYFNYYTVPWFGVQVGLDFIGKGSRYSGTVLNEDWRTRLRFVHMIIPISMRFNIDNRFQITAGIALSVAVSGATTTHAGDVKVEHKWEGAAWDAYYRANIAPKVSLGYAIPIGPIRIIPGMTWMLHLINDLNNDEIAGSTMHAMRLMNIMFDVGVEWFFK